MTEKNSPNETQTLKKGLVELMAYIQKIKKELALIKHPDDHFTEISDELDAVIEATEQATSDIMENSEKIDDIVIELKKHVKDTEAQKKLDTICDHTSNIIVSCSFQDITGQRVTKVLRTMQYVEERINSLIATWGEKEIKNVKIDTPEEKDEYQKYLNGPALKGQGVTQDQVDAMLKDTNKATPSNPALSKNAKPPTPTAATVKKAPTKNEAATINQSDIDDMFK